MCIHMCLHVCACMCVCECVCTHLVPSEKRWISCVKTLLLRSCCTFPLHTHAHMHTHTFKKMLANSHTYTRAHTYIHTQILAQYPPLQTQTQSQHTHTNTHIHANTHRHTRKHTDIHGFPTVAALLRSTALRRSTQNSLPREDSLRKVCIKMTGYMYCDTHTHTPSQSVHV